MLSYSKIGIFQENRRKSINQMNIIAHDYFLQQRFVLSKSKNQYHFLKALNEAYNDIYALVDVQNLETLKPR